MKHESVNYEPIPSDMVLTEVKKFYNYKNNYINLFILYNYVTLYL